MASFIESALRAGAGSAANTTALTQWANYVSQVIDNGLSPSQSQVVALWHATGVPLGSAFGQWGLRVSLDVLPSIMGYPELNDMTRQLEQKSPTASSRWAEQVSAGIGAPVG